MSQDTGGGPLRRFEDVLKEELADPEFWAEWTRLAPARAVALRLVGYRVEHGLTQTALGRLVAMSRPAIARIEAADHFPSVETLIRLADALQIEFLLDIKPSHRATSWVSPEIAEATVVEKVTTARGGQLLIAAS